jgi:hypothetical protein
LPKGNGVGTKIFAFNYKKKQELKAMEYFELE